MKVVKPMLVALALWSGIAAAADLSVRDSWIREAPPNASALGAFMVVRNGADKPRVIVGARSAAADKLELHHTAMRDGMAAMVRQDAIEVPAKGEVNFAPGGLHIMLIGPKQALKAGDKVEITLEFKDGLTMPVTFAVRRDDGMAMDHGAMHH